MPKTQNTAAQQSTQQKYFGRFVVRGTVVRKIRTKSALIFAVATGNSTAQKTDFPRFVAITNAEELDNIFKIGDRVTVTAHMRTSKKYPNGTLVPDSVVVEKNKMDAAFAGEKFLADKNEAVIRGQVAGAPYSPNDSVTLLSLKVDLADGSYAYLRTVAFGRVAQTIRRKKAGEDMEAVGYIRTKSFKETGDTAKNQSIVIISAR